MFREVAETVDGVVIPAETCSVRWFPLMVPVMASVVVSLMVSVVAPLMVVFLVWGDVLYPP